jgi:hypothetical protein
MLAQNAALKHEHLREIVFDQLHSKDLQVPSGTDWHGKQNMLLPPSPKGVMKYLPELPPFFEVEIAFDPHMAKCGIVFVLTAAEYVPLPKQKIPDVQWKRQLRFPVEWKNGRIQSGEALYRDQDKSEDELRILARPKASGIAPKQRICTLRMISADNVCRVHLDGRLIWSCYRPFFGGHFEMRYRTPGRIRIRRFTIYDTRSIQPGEKRKSRLKLP